MERSEQLYMANLNFLLNYTDGTAKDEIEHEIFKASFQVKESIHYDRAMGGGFQDLEQEPMNEKDLVSLKFGINLIQSMYLVNTEKGGDPYIVIGFSDIVTNQPDPRETTLYVTVYYRLLSDLTNVGQIEMEL